MLQDALTWSEQRCRAEAPSLLEDVRRVASLAAPPRVTASLLGDSVTLDDTGDDEVSGAPPIGPTERCVDLGLIGTGGMGEVRRVRDLELNRIVALKRVRPSSTCPRS